MSSSVSVLHKYSVSACDQSLTLSAAARSLFVKSTPPFQRVHSLIGVTDNLSLGSSNVRFQNCAVASDRRQDYVRPAATRIDFETQRRHHVADSPDRCIQIVVRHILIVQGMESDVHPPFSASASPLACQRSCSCTTSVEPQRSYAPSDPLVPVASTT